MLNSKQIPLSGARILFYNNKNGSLSRGVHRNTAHGLEQFRQNVKTEINKSSHKPELYDNNLSFFSEREDLYDKLTILIKAAFNALKGSTISGAPAGDTIDWPPTFPAELDPFGSKSKPHHLFRGSNRPIVSHLSTQRPGLEIESKADLIRHSTIDGQNDRGTSWSKKLEVSKGFAGNSEESRVYVIDLAAFVKAGGHAYDLNDLLRSVSRYPNEQEVTLDNKGKAMDLVRMVRGWYVDDDNGDQVFVPNIYYKSEAPLPLLTSGN